MKSPTSSDEISRKSAQVDIDDVIEHVHHGLRKLPDFVTLYRKYLKQRWDVYELDFTQDRIDWTEKMTEDERESFVGIASGFHHGERQVEIELPVFMIGRHRRGEAPHRRPDRGRGAAHRLLRPVLSRGRRDRGRRHHGGARQDVPVGAGDLRRPVRACSPIRPTSCAGIPYDQRARVRYGTTYFLWIEGVLALSVMKVTLSYARWRGFLPAYYTGFTATCRDESRHVQGGMRYLQDAVRKDPTMLTEIHDTLRTILMISGVSSRKRVLRAAGLDGGRGSRAADPAAPAQMQRRRHLAVARARGSACADRAGAGGRLTMSMFFS